MKIIFGLALVATSFTLSAWEVYECDFTGPNYLLTIENNQTITLKSSFKSFQWQKGTVNFPGTELNLSVLNCNANNEKISYYYSELNEDLIILSKSLVLSKDISCKRIL